MMNNITILSITLLLLLSVSNGFSQKRCATEERYELLLNRLPQKEKHQTFENWLYKKQNSNIQKNQARRAEDDSNVAFKIPVVVHVIHGGEPLGEGSNISDAQIFTQIEVLNEDFQRLNKDSINTPDHFKPVAADVGVEFTLAKRDPDGLPTNGIQRVFSEKQSWSYFFDEEELKSLSYWPAEDYLNIWVVKSLGNNYVAFATYPVSDLPGINEPNYNRLLDGVVIIHDAFGSVEKGNFDLQEKYNLGRTLTHEIGHYLGLRHTWGDGGCSADDFCDDTPQSSDSYNGQCPSIGISCGSEDMFQNYMNYTNDACMNLFTQCQKGRMVTVLENSPRRLSLLNSLGATPLPGFGIDLSIARIISPSNVNCENSIAPQIEIINSGTETIDNFVLAYQYDEVSVDTLPYTNFNLEPQESRLIDFNAISLDPGQHTFEIAIVDVEGEKDTDDANNQQSITFLIDNRQDFIPLKETFRYNELDSTQWSVLNPDNSFTWDVDETRRGQYAATIQSFNYSAIGAEDWFISPVLDFSMATEASMKFRVSYSARENRNDLLKIIASTDCGRSFETTIYEKLANSFAVDSTNEAWTPQNDEAWHEELLVLNQFIGEENVRLAFVFVNGNGNNIYLDNIEFFVSENPDAIFLQEENSFKVYPNPTYDNNFDITFSLDERDEVFIKIFNSVGKILYHQTFPNTLNQTYPITFPAYNPGIYFVQVKSNFVNKIKQIVFY